MNAREKLTKSEKRLSGILYQRGVDEKGFALMPTLAIKAKDFANELTSHNTEVKDLKGAELIGREHVENNMAVRKMLLQRGVKPAEDIQKVKRKLDGDGKKVLKEAKQSGKKKK